jgi:predicted DNA-binding transcriptional regulator AlpA
MKTNAAAPAMMQLMPEALYSWNEIEPFVKVGRETWRRRVLTGAAPQPHRISARCTRYLGRDVLAWITSPATYRTDTAGQK